MKHYMHAMILLALTCLPLQAVPSYEMERICKDRAVQTYRIDRESIHLAVPRYLNGLYSTYGKSPKKGENALFFVCNFDRNGRFLSIRTEKDLRRNSANNSRVTKAAKRSCKGEASSVWRVSPREVSLTNIRRINRGRYHLTVRSGNRTAVCDVNTQGHIYSFQRSGNVGTSNRKARRACKVLASKLWKVPASRVQIYSTRKINRDRFRMNVRYKGVTGRCDVSRSGRIYHFRTQH